MSMRGRARVRCRFDHTAQTAHRPSVVGYSVPRWSGPRVGRLWKYLRGKPRSSRRAKKTGRPAWTLVQVGGRIPSSRRSGSRRTRRRRVGRVRRRPGIRRRADQRPPGGHRVQPDDVFQPRREILRVRDLGPRRDQVVPDAAPGLHEAGLRRGVLQALHEGVVGAREEANDAILGRFVGDGVAGVDDHLPASGRAYGRTTPSAAVPLSARTTSSAWAATSPNGPRFPRVTV